MHVVHIITRLIVGGAQENTLLSCAGLHEKGRRVTLISGPSEGPEGRLIERASSGGYVLIEAPELVRAIRPWQDWRARRRLAAILRDLRPDIVHTHSSKAGILGRLAAADANTPHVVHTIHGMSFNRTQPWLLRRLYIALERSAARRSSAIVTVADAMIEQTVAAGICPREKLLTIYSGMETERFDPALNDRNAVRRGWGVPQDAIVVGVVARLFRDKGYEQMIPIMARAAAAEPRLRFVWVGEGAQRAAYVAALRRLGLAERVTLTGLVAPAEIPGLIAGFDILAHTSQWEGLPRAVVQALLMEKPVVAFSIDGTPEVVRNGETGFCVPLNDASSFGAALMRLANDEPLRRTLGAAGRALCRERFDWRRMVNALDQLYSRLLNGRGVQT